MTDSIPIHKFPSWPFLSVIDSLTNRFSKLKFFGSSGSEPSTTDKELEETKFDSPDLSSEELPGTEASSKQDSAEKDSNPFSLDDIDTPGDRSEWINTPIPQQPQAAQKLRVPGRFSDLESESLSLCLIFKLFWRLAA